MKGIKANDMFFLNCAINVNEVADDLVAYVESFGGEEL